MGKNAFGGEVSEPPRGGPRRERVSKWNRRAGVLKLAAPVLLVQGAIFAFMTP
jgi:hypothetical protein